MASKASKLIMRLAEGGYKATDPNQLENAMKEVIDRVWCDDLIVDDMETEQIWYQVDDILRPHVDVQINSHNEADDIEDEDSNESDGAMEEEDMDNDDENEEDDQSIGDDMNEELSLNDDNMEIEDDEDIEEEDEHYDEIQDDQNAEDDNDEPDNEDKNQSHNQLSGNSDTDNNNPVNGDNDSYNQYEFDDEEYNQYLDDMDEQDLNQEDNDKDDEELEMEEEDESDAEANGDEDKEDDLDDAEDVFRTLAYGTHEKNIEQIESKLVEKKGWQLRGEIRAHDREKNTLLEEDLEFQRGVQTKTKISKETNEKYESIIKQRILDVAFDDRSSSTYFYKPVVSDQVKELPELDFEKDKRGLAGIYEDQYKKNVMGIDEKKSKDDKAKDQVKDLYRLICFSIDNMTRFQYNPNIVPLADKKTSDGFIVDEKIPIVVSGDLLKDRKPFKEVYNPKDKEMKSKSEITKEEKLRLRRKIKKTMKAKRERIRAKEIEKTGMRGSDYKILEKNQSKIKKQIQDSKAKDAVRFTRKSEFFATVGKNVN